MSEKNVPLRNFAQKGENKTLTQNVVLIKKE